MTTLFLDIETVPSEPPKHQSAKAASTPKDSPGKSDWANGAFGRICCLAYAVNDSPIKVLSGDETRLLIDFWQLAGDIDLFVGFNIFDFDLRFIWQRSVILGVKPSRDLPFVRHTASPIYDVMYEWCRWSGGVGSRVGLDTLAKALGIPSSKTGSVVGRTVAKAYAAGRISDICAYCARDVEATRSIYRRLIFTADP